MTNSGRSNWQASGRFDRVFTIARWLPQYQLRDLRGDALAGLTVGVLLIPQSMAYAMLAGVPPIYGLYASLVPLLVYPIFGSSRHLAGGVVAIDMLIVAAGLSALATPGSQRYIELAILLAATAGVIQILMGVARLGFVVNLLSRPIITGFAGAAAIIIAISQIGSFVGVDLPQSPLIHEVLPAAVGSLGQFHQLTLGIGLATVAILLLLKQWLPKVPGALFVVLVATAATWKYGLNTDGVRIVGDVSAGLSSFSVPAFSVADVQSIFSTAATLALIQFMSVITLGKVFASKHRYSIRPNRELAAMGAANLVGSFFRSIPVSGSFSRTAVNDQNGARTPLANVFAALLIGVTLLFLTPLVKFLPITVLAAIIIVAAIGLIDLQQMRTLWRVKRTDGAVAILTFALTLFVGIQAGIFAGIVASVVAIMYRISVPNVAELGRLPGTRSFRDIKRYKEAEVIRGALILRIDASFSFANAEFLKDALDSRTIQDDSIRAVIIDASSVNDLDTTAAAALDSAADLLSARGVELYFGGVRGRVSSIVQKCGLYDKLGEDHFHLSPHRALEYVVEGWVEEADEGGEGDRLEVDDEILQP